jgi:hypothetical protein
MDNSLASSRGARGSAVHADEAPGEVLRALARENAALKGVVDLLDAVAGKPIPIYFSRELRPVANLKTGATKDKVLVCSIPKSGTYLWARLLERLGIEPSGLHVAPVYMFDNRLKTPDQARRDIRLDEIELPIAQSVKLIADGQFALSHLSPSPSILDLIQDFKVLFVYRNLRDALVSHMRYVSHPKWGTDAYAPLKLLDDSPEKTLQYLNRGGAAFFDERCRPVADWIREPRALAVSFEAIYGDRGQEAQAETIESVCQHCGIDSSALDPQSIMSEVIGSSTPTWSGARTRWNSCWNSEVEARFVALGGRALNQQLGYAE